MTEVERAYREHRGELLATLLIELRSFDLAEEVLQDAFAAAAAQWPAEGVPRRPGGWLLTVARRRAADRRRRAETEARHRPSLIIGERGGGAGELPVIFACCHPALALPAQVALTLRFVGGLTVPEIARLFLVSPATMAARITRAKQKIREAGIPLRVPAGPERTAGVLAAVYLIFTEGYRATAGDRLIREELAAEAIRLGRLLCRRLPGEPEATALLALMLLQHARRRARIRDGRLVRLPEQDRSRWDAAEIAEGLALLERPAPAGEYRLQALIAAGHALAAEPADTDWPVIAGLYARLEELTGSPVVRLNRPVAVAEADGPAAGLELLAGLDPLLPRHHHLPAARGELLLRLGRHREAAAAFGRALELAGTRPERDFLAARLRAAGPDR